MALKLNTYSLKFIQQKFKMCKTNRYKLITYIIKRVIHNLTMNNSNFKGYLPRVNFR